MSGNRKEEERRGRAHKTQGVAYFCAHMTFLVHKSHLAMGRVKRMIRALPHLQCLAAVRWQAANDLTLALRFPSAKHALSAKHACARLRRAFLTKTSAAHEHARPRRSPAAVSASAAELRANKAVS
eukprot:6179089-Pleurochrysis_carterae.AAC.1